MTAVRTASTRDKAKEISAKGMVTVNPASRIGHRAFSIMDNVCCKIYSPFLFILKIKKLFNVQKRITASGSRDTKLYHAYNNDG
jgi:hypothetical protein